MKGARFVIYTRVSTARQGRSGLGLDAQRKMCLDLIQREGGECAKEFQDVESGKSRTRPGLWNAIDYCKAYDCTLVIAKLDRLARDVEFTFKVLNSGIQIRFCDMPVMNTMVLGVFASVAQYERELISGRTKGALDAIKDDIKMNGGHVSKTGRYIKKLGPEKGADTSAATAAAVIVHSKHANEWRQDSALYTWVENQLLKRRPRKEILAEAEEMYIKNPSKWGTRQGRPLSKGILSVWAREIQID